MISRKSKIAVIAPVGLGLLCIGLLLLPAPRRPVRLDFLTVTKIIEAAVTNARSGRVRRPLAPSSRPCARARHGLPRGQSGERGDLYVVVNVELPQNITDEERALWEKLRSTSRFNPRQQT